MRTAVIQIRPFTGDLSRNVMSHVNVLSEVCKHDVDLAIFPELSITGYEPSLSEELAIVEDDSRLEPIQKICSEHNVTVGVGAPIRVRKEIRIGLVFFRPHQPSLTYFKKYLHPDELLYFSSGENIPVVDINGTKVAPSICYELSQEEHRSTAISFSPSMYVASVAKYERGMLPALRTLEEFSRASGLPVMISNSIGPADGGLCCGMSSIWNTTGMLIAQLDANTEGFIIYDSLSDTAATFKWDEV